MKTHEVLVSLGSENIAVLEGLTGNAHKQKASLIIKGS